MNDSFGFDNYLWGSFPKLNRTFTTAGYCE